MKLAELAENSLAASKAIRPPKSRPLPAWTTQHQANVTFPSQPPLLPFAADYRGPAILHRGRRPHRARPRTCRRWPPCVPPILISILPALSSFSISRPLTRREFIPPRSSPNPPKIGADAHIGPYCFVDEEAAIGAGSVLHSFVTIYRGAEIGDHFFAHAHAVVREHCKIGDRVILQNGVVIGGDGLGFAKQKDGSWYKMAQSGPAVLEDDVEVQANACVDRATVGETRIGRGSKLDDLVFIGHASQVGRTPCSAARSGLPAPPRSATAHPRRPGRHRRPS